jgi:hypothetical protein
MANFTQEVFNKIKTALQHKMNLRCTRAAFTLALLRTKLHFGLLHLFDVFEVASQRLDCLPSQHLLWSRFNDSRHRRLIVKGLDATRFSS